MDETGAELIVCGTAPSAPRSGFAWCEKPVCKLDPGCRSTPNCATARRGLGSALSRVRLTGSHAGGAAAGGDMEVLYPHCAGLDVHKDTVVACVRHMVNGSVRREVRSFKTTTKELLALSDWLAGEGCTMSRWRRPASTGSRCGMS